MKQIIIRNSLFFDQVAILEDGKLSDFIYEEKNNENLLGNIYKGKVVNILSGMEACFVDIGLEKNAYLYKDDLLSFKFLKEKNIKKKDVKNISKIIKSGEEILVQINREPIGEKNISVTTDISLPGKFIALIPNSIEVNISSKIKNFKERERLENIGKNMMSDGNGMIIRTFSVNANEEAIKNEYNFLSSSYKQIQKEYNYSYAPKLMYKSNSLIDRAFLDYIDSTVDEIYVNDSKIKEKISELTKTLEELKNIKLIETSNLHEIFNVEKQIDMLFDRKVELDKGGSIFIDVTEALTVIDVNSGKFIGTGCLEETALELNLAALEEISRQIKLRNISGIIIIDFIDVKNQENMDLIIEKAKKVFKSDKAKINILGMTKLNLMELTRKKDKENFYNLMTDECEHCRGNGRVNSKVQILYKIENLVINIKKNTSSEGVILSVGSMMFRKMQNMMNMINSIEDNYNIKIFFKENNNILTEEIKIEKIGKIDYINEYM